MSGNAESRLFTRLAESITGRRWCSGCRMERIEGKTKRMANGRPQWKCNQCWDRTKGPTR